MNEKTSVSSSESDSKSMSPALMALIGVGAVIAGLLAYFITTRLVSAETDLCAEAKAEILAIKAEAPDAAMLDTRPDLSLRLTNAGQQIFDSCMYRDGREFEMQNVEPWLGLPPAPGATAPTTVPATDGSATDAPASTLAPETTSTTAGG
jgi:hypothetical protein